MIFFIGYTASGKSTIANRYAQYRGYPFLDLDQFIEKNIQTDISSYFNTHGENAFREIERSSLVSIINHAPKNTIVACGGGTPCFYDNLELMKSNGMVVYLVTPLNKIIDHLKSADINKRPTIINNQLISSSKIEEHLKGRLPFYEQAHLKIPLKLAKNPELLTMQLILFTNSNPALRKLHFLF